MTQDKESRLDKKDITSLLTDLVNTLVKLTGKTRFEILNEIHLHIPLDEIQKNVLIRMLKKESYCQLSIDWTYEQDSQLLIGTLFNTMIKLKQQNSVDAYSSILKSSLLNAEQTQILFHYVVRFIHVKSQLDTLIRELSKKTGLTKLEIIRKLQAKVDKIVATKDKFSDS